MAIPAIAELRHRFPQDELILLTGISASAEVRDRAKQYSGVQTPPWMQWVRPRWIDRVVVFSDWRSLRDWWSLRAEISKASVEKTFLLPYYNEAPFSLIKKWLWLRSLGVTSSIIGIRSASGAREKPSSVNAQMWQPWKVALGSEEPNGSLPLIEIATCDQVWSRDLLLARFGPGEFRVVAVFPAATHEHKRWPVERFSAVCDGLVIDQAVRIVFIGSAADQSWAEATREKMVNSSLCANLCGETSLGQLAAILQQSALFLGNDGGPAHLAAAVGTPGVTIMSGVHAAGVWDPSGVDQRSVRVDGLACIGCGSENVCPAGHRKCILDISVDEVLANCRAILYKGSHNSTSRSLI